MIPAEHSLFGGGPLPPKLTAEQEERKRVRDAKWEAAQILRAQMDEQSKIDEQERIRAQVEEILAARQRAA